MQGNQVLLHLLILLLGERDADEGRIVFFNRGGDVHLHLEASPENHIAYIMR